MAKVATIMLCVALIVCINTHFCRLCRREIREAGFTISVQTDQAPPNSQQILKDWQEVWIPNDPYGISDSELLWIRSRYPLLSISNAGAAINEDGHLLLLDATSEISRAL